MLREMEIGFLTRVFVVADGHSNLQCAREKLMCARTKLLRGRAIRISVWMSVALLACTGMGCGSSEADDTDSRDDGSRHVERVTDAEETLALLGFDAWVFRYSGGPVQAELRFTYMPEGETTDDAVELQGVMHSTLLAHVDSEDRDDTSSGVIIITYPPIGYVNEQIRPCLSFYGAQATSFEPPKEYDEFINRMSVTLGYELATEEIPNAVNLELEESATLLDVTIRPPSDEPELEPHSMRMKLIVTPLIDDAHDPSTQ